MRTRYRAKIDWDDSNIECCEYLLKVGTCYRVDITYNIKKDKHEATLWLDESICIDIEKGYINIKDVYEEIGVYHELG